MARGYHRRNADAWRRTRLQVVTLLNLHRGEKDPLIHPEEYMPLYGDLPPAGPARLSEEQLTAALAEMADLDPDW